MCRQGCEPGCQCGNVAYLTMAHLYYQEEQRFTNVRWLWLVLILIILLPLLLTYNDKGMNQQELITLFLSTLLAVVPVVAMLFFSKLQLRIDDGGIHYRFFPGVWKWKTITKTEIESFEFSDMKSLFEKWETGYCRNLFTDSIRMNITGKKFLRMKLKDGGKIKIGSENPEEMERALKRLTTEYTLQ